MKKGKEKYIAFLRGINVGGHHKVPMAELRSALQKLSFENVVTLLNSGNIIFDADTDNIERMELRISECLEKTFGFSVPTIVQTAENIHTLIDTNLFEDITLTKETRLYISFLRKDVANDIELPWISEDGSYQILALKNKAIWSVLDLSIAKTPKAMEILEKSFGSDITTRNWNTIKRIEKKLRT